MMKALHLALAALIAASGPAAASAEDSLIPIVEAIRFNTLIGGYRISLEADHEGVLKKVVVEQEGKTASYGPKELPVLKGVHLKRVDLKYEQGQPGVVRPFFIAIPYHRVSHNSHKDEKAGDNKPLYTVDVARIYFDKTRLLHWEICEAVEDEPGKWKSWIYAPDEKRKYEEDRFEVGKNPFIDFDFSGGEL